MSNRKMSAIIPYLTVKDAGRAARLYRDLFGFEILSEAVDEKGKTNHAELRYNEIDVMCGSEGAWGSKVKTPASAGFLAPTTLYVYVDDVNTLSEALQNHSEINVTMELQDAFWGDRMIQVTVSDGNAWTFATPLSEL